jgi:UDP:flavonoid glycosyltransferase YjiC (YdhE family)
MRVLFSSTPFAGHLFPLLPLERAARHAGHATALLTSAPLSSAVDDDAVVLPAGPMPDVLLAEVARRKGTDPTRDNSPEIVAELFAGTRVDLSCEAALAAAEDWRPDLVVFEYCDFVGPMVAAALRCPAARLAYGRAYRPEYEGTMQATASERYRRSGLDPATPVAFLDTCPPSLQVPGWRPPAGHRYLRPEPHQHAAADWTAPTFEDRGHLPSVLVTFGTVFSGASVVATVLESLRYEGVNVIVTVGPHGDPAALEVDPARVRVERFVPLDRLLLTGVSAVVSHGGGGTILAALSRGLPLVLLPQGADQFHNAEPLEGLAAGVTLPPETASPHAIRNAVHRAFGDLALRAGARRLAAEIAAMDPPATVIEALARRVGEAVALAG